jgi:hypothetical protein
VKKIEIIVDTKGQTRVETKGFAGSDCVEASRFIEQALGKQVTQRTTPEFFRAQTQQNNQLHQPGG